MNFRTGVMALADMQQIADEIHTAFRHIEAMQEAVIAHVTEMFLPFDDLEIDLIPIREDNEFCHYRFQVEEFYFEASARMVDGSLVGPGVRVESYEGHYIRVESLEEVGQLAHRGTL